jgi:hypothetical protein
VRIRRIDGLVVVAAVVVLARLSLQWGTATRLELSRTSRARVMAARLIMIHSPASSQSSTVFSSVIIEIVHEPRRSLMVHYSRVYIFIILSCPSALRLPPLRIFLFLVLLREDPARSLGHRETWSGTALTLRLPRATTSRPSQRTQSSYPSTACPNSHTQRTTHHR